MKIPTIGNLPRLHPDSVLVAQTLKRTYQPFTYLSLSPNDELYGTFEVASISTSVIASLDEAILALWKITLCANEEWPYEEWDHDTVQDIVKAWYTRHYSFFVSSHSNRSPETTVTALEALVAKVCDGQKTMEQPLNPPQTLPNMELTLAEGLNQLDYIQLSSLGALVSDHWNDIEALFQHRKRWFFVLWGTSA